MKILEITEHNFDSYKANLIELNDQFLKDLNIFKERTTKHKEAILSNMIRQNSPTHILLVLEEEEAVGMTYFNEGTGYSCGGNYVWLNSIYVKPEAQKKGYGSALLSYVETWAKGKGVTLFVSSRDVDNEKSRTLFQKNGFKQSENISMNKVVEAKETISTFNTPH